MSFKCPKCGGYHFGTDLNAEHKIVGYVCGNSTEGKPLWPMSDPQMRWRGQKDCGWKGKPEEVAWVEEVPREWIEEANEMGREGEVGR